MIGKFIQHPRAMYARCRGKNLKWRRSRHASYQPARPQRDAGCQPLSFRRSSASPARWALAILAVTVCCVPISFAEVDPNGPPDRVASVSVTHNGSSLTVTWDAPAGATHYDVTYYNIGSGQNARAAWNRAGTSLAITCDIRPEHLGRYCVSSGATYTVGVRARNASGESAWRNSALASVAALSVPAPTGLAVSETDGVVTLSWASVPIATSYQYTCQAGGVTTGPTPVPIAGTRFTLSGLNLGQAHTFQVYALYYDQWSAASASVTLAASASPPGTVPFVLAAHTGTSLSVAWVLAENATSYLVTYRADGGEWQDAATVTDYQPLSTITISGVDAETSYRVGVVARNSAGDSARVEAPIAHPTVPIIKPISNITTTLGTPLRDTPIRFRDPDHTIVDPCVYTRLNSDNWMTTCNHTQDRLIGIEDDYRTIVDTIGMFNVYDEGHLVVTGTVSTEPEGVVGFSMGYEKVVGKWMEIEWDYIPVGAGTTTVTVTITDPHGASATQSFSVTVRDLIRANFGTNRCWGQGELAADFASVPDLWDETAFVVNVDTTFPNADELMDIVEDEADKINHALGYYVFSAGEIVELPGWDSSESVPDGRIEVRCCIPDDYFITIPGGDGTLQAVPSGLAEMQNRIVWLISHNEPYYAWDMLPPMTKSARVLPHELWHILGFMHPGEGGLAMSQVLMWMTGKPDLSDMRNLACIYD